MGLGVIFILVGLIGVVFGLKRDAAGNAVLAIGGWLVFLVGVLRILVPGFFS